MINSNLWFLVFMLSIGIITWSVELIKYLKERKAEYANVLHCREIEKL